MCIRFPALNQEVNINAKSERLRILVELDAIPSDFDERMTQGVERMLFDWLVGEGRLSEIIVQTEKLLSERKEGSA